LEAITDVDVGHLQSLKDFHCGGPAYGVGKVVVPHQHEGRYAGIGESREAPGELPLVSLGRITAFVGVSGQQHQVNSLVESAIDYLIQRG
jgi:hypothetical protein